MKLRLSENPNEWRKALLVWTAAPAIGLVVLACRGRVTPLPAGTAIAAIVVVALVGLARPILFRPVYRAVMTVTFHVGQVVGRVVLFVFFLAIITPLALLLRAMGKDLLQLRRSVRETSYWREAPALGSLRKLF